MAALVLNPEKYTHKHFVIDSAENSTSTNEFLHLERSCDGQKDSDEEIKSIFDEIHKLTGDNIMHVLVGADNDDDDVDVILKKAEDIAQKSQHILKNSPQPKNGPGIRSENTPTKIPHIKVTKPKETENVAESKENGHVKPNAKESSNEVRRKRNVRPFSASMVETKKKEALKVSKHTLVTPKKSSINSKDEQLIDELKDTKERAKGLELLNVELTENNKVFRKKLEEISEEKHIVELKLIECERFISKLGKEYENRKAEINAIKENENRLLSELTRDRNERKNLTVQRDKDKIVIQDLQRQCKEMELILKRKHPDSVSALIVASKSSTVDDNKKKLLEERISRLEDELKDKEDHFQSVLLTLQEKFSEMKLKYESHIIDIERQLMEDRKLSTELKNKLNKTNLVDAFVQTSPRIQSKTVAIQTSLKSAEHLSSAASRLSQNSSILFSKLREDSYLIATIKGLQTELTAKQRTISKINRETEDLRKNLRNLQKEKEVLLNLNPRKKGIYKQTKSVDNILARVNTEMEAELVEARNQREVVLQERNSLLESLKRTNEEFILLKKKRIQDLHTLQLAHEKELMQMNMQVFPMQEEIQLLNRTVELLQDRIRVAEDKLMRGQGEKGGEVYAGGDNGGNRSRASARNAELRS